MRDETYTEFFRCLACARWYEMTEHLATGKTKCKCGTGRFVPTILTRREALVYLLTHPRVLLATLQARLKK